MPRKKGAPVNPGAPGFFTYDLDYLAPFLVELDREQVWLVEAPEPDSPLGVPLLCMYLDALPDPRAPEMYERPLLLADGRGDLYPYVYPRIGEVDWSATAVHCLDEYHPDWRRFPSFPLRREVRGEAEVQELVPCRAWNAWPITEHDLDSLYRVEALLSEGYFAELDTHWQLEERLAEDEHYSLCEWALEQGVDDHHHRLFAGGTTWCCTAEQMYLEERDHLFVEGLPGVFHPRDWDYEADIRSQLPGSLKEAYDQLRAISRTAAWRSTTVLPPQHRAGLIKSERQFTPWSLSSPSSAERSQQSSSLPAAHSAA